MCTSRFLSIRNLGRIFGFVLRGVATSCVPWLWPVHGTANVYQSLHSDFRVGTLEGHAPPSLSGRLAGHCGVEDPSAASGCGSPVVQGSGDRCQLGEVRPPAVHSCPVSRDVGRHVPQEGVSVGSSSSWLSGSGDFLPASSVATSTHVAAVVGLHVFTGVFSSLRSLTHAFFAMAPQRITGPPWWTTQPFRFFCYRSAWRQFVGDSRRTGGCLASLSRFLLHPCCCILMRLCGVGEPTCKI